LVDGQKAAKARSLPRSVTNLNWPQPGADPGIGRVRWPAAHGDLGQSAKSLQNREYIPLGGAFFVNW
jgi:hypothetical protein